MSDKARAEVLEVLVYPMCSFVLSSSITSATHHIVAVEANTSQLFLHNASYISTSFPSAVHDVC